MDTVLLVQALRLAIASSLPVLGAALLGALLLGLVRAATQIEDGVLTFVGKFVAVGLLFYLASGIVTTELLNFAERVWTGSDFYR